MRYLFAIAALVLFASPATAEPAHGIAMHGSLKHGPGFKHFSYVNPAAPKGGRLNLAAVGSFDSLNPLIIKGVSAAGIRGYVYESLMARAFDEPFSLYGLLAETVETPDDRSWVSFTLRKEAAFSDGTPVTVDDVVFSHALLRDKGRPNHRFYYAKVARIERIGSDTIKFHFSADGDREMPLIMGLMPILPKRHVSPESFEKTSLTAPIGSGPYLVDKIDPGMRIAYRRNPNYWGHSIPANRGRFNFDEIRFDYYRDSNSLFEGFKKGLIDIRSEPDPGQWSLAYDFPAAKDGRVEKEQFDLAIPAGMSALVFNTRRPIFADKRVRKAITLLFDFEWMNKNLYHGLYSRTQSYFSRSELSSHGRPADDYERKLLAAFANEVDPDVLNGTHKAPVSSGTGRNRRNLRQALALFENAGFVLKGGKLIHKASQKPFRFEILAATRAQERLLLSFARALKRAGIEAEIRQVDSSQYQRRKTSYDFDMIQNHWTASLSPGNEQNFRWSSKAAATEGTFNFAGIQSPAVDAMIHALLAAKNRVQFVSAVRALDRVLLSGRYVLPLFHLPRQWVARWNHLRHPDKASLYGYRLDSWWAEARP